MAQLEVSVVMSVYNNADTLPASLESVLSQEGVDFEFIVIDDGSTDGSGEILDQFAAQDSRMKVVHKNNEGLTRALIDGCAMASGTYIARIDNGDAMLPGRLRRQKEVLERCPDVVFVSCWAEFCGPEWESLYTYKGNGCLEQGQCVLPVNPDEDLSDVPCHHGSVMFRRDVYEEVGGYRWQFYYAQDWDLWYRLAERGNLAVIPDVLYRARLFGGGISSLNRERQLTSVQIARTAFFSRRQMRSDVDCLQDAEKIRPEYFDDLNSRDHGDGVHFIGEILRKNGDIRCRNYFWIALKVNLFRANTWVRLLQSICLTSRDKRGVK